MILNYIPPAIIHQVEEAYPYSAKPYFYEINGKIINLALATSFYVDHFPLTSYYWPCVKIGGNSYQLTSSMKSKEEAMNFIKNLTEKIEKGSE